MIFVDVVFFRTFLHLNLSIMKNKNFRKRNCYFVFEVIEQKIFETEDKNKKQNESFDSSTYLLETNILW